MVYAPNGAAECSHGWSVAEPVDASFNAGNCSGGAEEIFGRRRRRFRPFRAIRFLTPVHGLRVGRVAPFRRFTRGYNPEPLRGSIVSTVVGKENVDNLYLCLSVSICGSSNSYYYPSTSCNFSKILFAAKC
jgi:hypothetical protein